MPLQGFCASRAVRRATSSNLRGVPSGFVASKVNIKILGMPPASRDHCRFFTMHAACGLAPWCEIKCGQRHLLPETVAFFTPTSRVQ